MAHCNYKQGNRTDWVEYGPGLRTPPPPPPPPIKDTLSINDTFHVVFLTSEGGQLYKKKMAGPKCTCVTPQQHACTTESFLHPLCTTTCKSTCFKMWGYFPLERDRGTQVWSKDSCISHVPLHETCHVHDSHTTPSFLISVTLAANIIAQ